MSIQQLPKAVQTALRSGVIVTNPAQSVVELVLNSLDAGATSIAVRVDLKIFKIQVVDNGCGMGLEQLDSLGPRYMTSKCHSLEDLHNNVIHYGFRGEALASLIEVSGLIVILSRPYESKETYCKAFTHGKAKQGVISDTNRPSNGTTITIQDFMCNMPVRQKRISEAIDLEEIRSHIECIALINPEVSFSLRNDSKRVMIVHKFKSPDLLTSFRHLFGQVAASSLASVSYTSNKFKVSGFVRKEPHQQKNLQFIYVNKRVVLKTKLHRLVNALLGKSAILRGNGPWKHKSIPKGASTDWLFAVAPPEKQRKFAVFVIHIECASREYDVYLDPSKTSIEFQDWEEVLHCVRESIRLFLERESLVYTDEECISSSQESSSSLNTCISDLAIDKEENHNNESNVTKSKTNKTGNSLSHVSAKSSEKSKQKNERAVTISQTKSDNKDVTQHRNSLKYFAYTDDIGTLRLSRAIHGVAAKRRDNINAVHDTKCKSTNKSSQMHTLVDDDSTIKDVMAVVCTGITENANGGESLKDLEDESQCIPLTQSHKSDCSYPKKDSLSKCNSSEGSQIVKFKHKSSAYDLKILKGAYLFKLNQVKEMRNRAVSKTLLKYNFKTSVTKELLTNNTLCEQNNINRFKTINGRDVTKVTLPNIISLIQNSQSVSKIHGFDLPTVSIQSRISFSKETNSYLQPTVKRLEENVLTDSFSFQNTDRKSEDILKVSFDPNDTINYSHRDRILPYPQERVLSSTVESDLGIASGLCGERNSHTNSLFDLIPSSQASKLHTRMSRGKNLNIMDKSFSNFRQICSETSITPSKMVANMSSECKRDFCKTEDFLHTLKSTQTRNQGQYEYVSQLESSFNDGDFNVQSHTFNIHNYSESVSELNSDCDTSRQIQEHFDRQAQLCRKFQANVAPDPYIETEEHNSKSTSYTVSPDIVYIRKQRKCWETPLVRSVVNEKFAPLTNDEESNLRLNTSCLSALTNVVLTKRKESLEDKGVSQSNLKDCNVAKSKAYHIAACPGEIEGLTNSKSIMSGNAHWGPTLNISEMEIISIPSPYFSGPQIVTKSEDHELQQNKQFSMTGNSKDTHFVNFFKNLNTCVSEENVKNVCKSNSFATEPSCSQTFLGTDHNINQFWRESVNSNGKGAPVELINVDRTDSINCLPIAASNHQMHKVHFPIESPYFHSKHIPSADIEMITDTDMETNSVLLGKKRKSDEFNNIYGKRAGLENNSDDIISSEGTNESKLVVSRNAKELSLTSSSISSKNCVNSCDNTFAKLSGNSKETEDDPIKSRMEDASNSQGHTLQEENFTYSQDINIGKHSLNQISSSVSTEEYLKTYDNATYKLTSNPRDVQEVDDSYSQGRAVSEHTVASREDKLSPIEVNEATEGTCSVHEQDLNQINADCTQTRAINTIADNLKEMQEVVKSSQKDVFCAQEDSNDNNNKCTTQNKELCSKVWIQKLDSKGEIFYVNTHNGMTLYNVPENSPKESLFTMTKRYNFLPKGMSPMLKDVVSDRTEECAVLTPNNREALHTAILNNAEVDDELATVKWKDGVDSRCTGSKELLKKLFTAAENRMKYCEKPVPSISLEGGSKLAVKMSNLVKDHKFDKNIFTNIQIVKQWDDKFIVTVVSLEKGKRPHVIGVFDQHAVHERIRLEALMKEYLVDASNCCFKSSDTSPHVNLDLGGKEVRILSSFKDEFQRIGLKYEILNDVSIKITNVPTCLYTREVRERSRGTSVLKNFLETLIQEHVEFLLKTRGSSCNIPVLLQEIINYESCRGAIKFGDSLTNEDCEMLLVSLSQCEMPFYCAHGRPSFVPIFDLLQL